MTNPSPVMSLFAQWEAAQTASYVKGLSEAEVDARVKVVTDLQDQILLTPGNSPADFVAKVAAYTAYGDGSLPGRADASLLWAEAEAILKAHRA